MRQWIAFPFHRSEDLNTNKKCVSVMKELENEGIHFPQRAFEVWNSNIEILTTYGRFPQRNKLFGRQSTSKEISYLKSNKKTIST